MDELDFDRRVRKDSGNEDAAISIAGTIWWQGPLVSITEYGLVSQDCVATAYFSHLSEEE